MTTTSNSILLDSHVATPPPDPTICLEEQLENDLDPFLNEDYIPPTFPKINTTTDFEAYRVALKRVYQSYLRWVHTFMAHPEVENSCAKLKKCYQAMSHGLEKWSTRLDGLFGVEKASKEVREVYGPLLDLAHQELKSSRGVMSKMLRLERALCGRMMGKFAAWEMEMFKRYGDRMARLCLELGEIERTRQQMIMQPVGNAIFYPARVSAPNFQAPEEWTADFVYDASDF